MGAPLGPLTEETLREWYREGVPLATIFSRAYTKEGWGRAKVREALFGKDY